MFPRFFGKLLLKNIHGGKPLLVFYYESAIEVLLAKGMIDADLATATKEKFYDSLNEEKLRTSQKSGTIMKRLAYTYCKKWCG